MVPQQYCLRWKHHHTNVQNMFAQLLEKERFCDVTLYCSPNFAAAHQDDSENIRGVSLRAHRVVLASCSELLGALLAAHEPLGEPVLVIDGAEPRHLRALLDYMYTGEMNVHHSQLASLLKTAEELRIKGLTDIRWNNKNELPDCQSGAVTTTSLKKHSSPEQRRHLDLQEVDPRYQLPFDREDGRHKYSDEDGREKTNVNGGPPPLIKLPLRTDKTSPLKREHSDNDSASPKRRRIQSGTENTDDEDRDPLEWQHGNLDISAERVVSWPRATEDPGERSDGSDGSDEWADAPADIGSFLHTRLRVDGDNSADEESNEGAPPSTSSSAGASAVDLKLDHLKIASKRPTDPRFTDVVKLNDYLKNGRRPQFWEEHYVKKVMEAVRVKELEMKQAAEILGVSYGTLYGRYRDVFGCINRPYRTARDFWQAKGPAEVLERLQRGEMSFDAGAVALGVSANNLAAYMADLNTSHYPVEKDFEPIPIEVDPSLKKTMVSGTANTAAGIVKVIRNTYGSDKSKKPNVSVTMSCPGEDDIPASVITTQDHAGNKWPSIRVANIESLREGGVPGAPPAAGPPASPTLLMRTRPDLTIVAARKPDRRDDT